MSEMEQTFLDSSGGGVRSSSFIKRTVTHQTFYRSLSGKGSDTTMRHISEAKGYLNEFEQMCRKHPGEIDALKRDHASESPESRVQGPESSPGSSPDFILCLLKAFSI